MADTQGYWDGRRWTDQIAPMIRGRKEEAPEVVAESVMTIGVVTGILIPIVGFIIGLTQINKKGGVSIVAVSVVCFFVWFWVLSSSVGAGVPYRY